MRSIVRKRRPGWSRRARLALRAPSNASVVAPPTRPAQKGIADAKHRRPFEERRPEAAFAPSPPQAGGGIRDSALARFICDCPALQAAGKEAPFVVAACSLDIIRISKSLT